MSTLESAASDTSNLCGTTDEDGGRSDDEMFLVHIERSSGRSDMDYLPTE